MKMLFYLSCFMLLACKPQTKKNDEIMKEKTIEFLKDNAFKTNTKMNLISFESLGYDTVNENMIDSARMDKIAGEMFPYVKKQILFYEEAKLCKEQSILYFGMDETISKMKDREALKATKEAEALGESLKVFEKKLTNIENKIRNRNSFVSIFFRSKAIIKASFYNNNDSTNILDTTYHYFDNKLNFIDVSKN